MDSKQLKLIFLDIDGVCNSTSFIREAHKSIFGENFRAVREEDFEKLSKASIDPKAIAILNNLIERSGAKVVISSSWRLNFSMDEITAMLKDKGFVGDIIGITPETTRPTMSRPEAQRAFEISDWLVQFEKLETVESLVILDDDEIGCGWDDWHVKPDKVNGLTKEDVEKALEILKMEW